MANQGEGRTRRIGSYLDVFRDVRVAWGLLWNKRVPTIAKVIPFLSLAYVLFPIDLLPDVVLGLGQLDDLAVVMLGLKLFVEVASGSMAESETWSRPEGTHQTASGGGAVVDSTYRVLNEDVPRSEQRPGRTTKKL